MSDGLDPVRDFARDLAAALRRYHAAVGGQRCHAGCTCPLARAVDAVEELGAAVIAYDAGNFVEAGLPMFDARLDHARAELLTTLRIRCVQLAVHDAGGRMTWAKRPHAEPPPVTIIARGGWL